MNAILENNVYLPLRSHLIYTEVLGNIQSPFLKFHDTKMTLLSIFDNNLIHNNTTDNSQSISSFKHSTMTSYYIDSMHPGYRVELLLGFLIFPKDLI